VEQRGRREALLRTLPSFEWSAGAGEEMHGNKHVMCSHDNTRLIGGQTSVLGDAEVVSKQSIEGGAKTFVCIPC
jgi:hypothetical protein